MMLLFHCNCNWECMRNHTMVEGPDSKILASISCFQLLNCMHQSSQSDLNPGGCDMRIQWIHCKGHLVAIISVSFPRQWITLCCLVSRCINCCILHLCVSCYSTEDHRLCRNEISKINYILNSKFIYTIIELNRYSSHSKHIYLLHKPWKLVPSNTRRWRVW